jgi:hypothetical protein
MMKFTAEQLALFKIEPKDSVAIYGTDSIPFLVVTPTDTAVTSVSSSVSLSVNVTAGTQTQFSFLGAF